jgi:hypothetical protein
MTAVEKTGYLKNTHATDQQEIYTCEVFSKFLFHFQRPLVSFLGLLLGRSFVHFPERKPNLGQNCSTD